MPLLTKYISESLTCYLTALICYLTANQSFADAETGFE